MNQSTIMALNLSTVAEIISLSMQTDIADLTAALEELKAKPNIQVNRCVISYIFLHWAEDISNLRKSVAQIRDTIDVPAILKDLEEYVTEMLIIQEELSHLENSFRPYLHCPASDIPEHSN